MRRAIGWLVGLAVVIAVLWVGYWFAARYVAQTAIARYASGGSTGVVCARPTVGGFPLVLDIRCERVTHEGSAINLTADIGSIAARAPLYMPTRVDATVSGPLTLNAPDRNLALTASWSLAEAHASAWIGGLTGGGAVFHSLGVQNADNLPGIPVSAMTAERAAVTVAPAAGNAFAVTGEAKQLVLTRDDGTDWPTVDAAAHVTLLDVGGTLGTDPTETLTAWLRDGGTIQIDRLMVASEGALVTADGKLNLASNGTLNGSLLVRWNDLDALLALADKLVPGVRAKLEEPVSGIGIRPIDGLTLMSAAVDTPDGPMRQTAITVRRGFLMLGVIPLPIGPIPPLTL